MITYITNKTLPYGQVVYLIDQKTMFDFGSGPVPAHRHFNGKGWVANSARVSGNAWVYGDAQVYGNAWEHSPLQIQGSRNFLNQCSYTHIAIGCEVHSIEWWLENYQEIGRSNNYSDAQIEEYHEYILLIAKLSARKEQ